MATDTFAKIGDIKGESQDDKHKEEIELLSWSWGVNQTGTASHGSGAGAGKASFSDFSFAHYVDKASPNLMKACATGEHIKEATITQRKAGKGQQEYLIIKMNDILITGAASYWSTSRSRPRRSTSNTNRRRRTARSTRGSTSSTT